MQMAVCLREIMLMQMPEPPALLLLLIALTSNQQQGVGGTRQEAAKHIQRTRLRRWLFAIGGS